MKKILLATTALIGASSMIAGAAIAGDLKVTIGGVADFQAGIMGDDLDGSQRAQGFRNDTEINFTVSGVADNGLEYGAEIDLEADVTADANSEGTNASRTYLFLKGGWGNLEMGSNTGAAGTMKVDASNLAAATGGIDGDWTYFANSAAGYLSTPDLVVGYGAGNLGDESTDNDNKITYYSPRFSGFQLGVSYIPDLTDRGQTVSRSDVGFSAGDIFQLGLNYTADWNEVHFEAAATGEWGDADSGAAEDLFAWNAGALVGYAGFSIAASYGDWDDSLSLANSDSDYWTLGGAYDFGPFGASITYLDSEFADTNDFDNLAIGVDYKLAPGLTPYAEVSIYDQDAPGNVNDNDGAVFIVGSQLAF